MLARGYAVVRDRRERPVTSATGVKSGAALSLEFHDGQRAAVRAAGPSKPRKTKRDEDDGQASLL